MWTLNKEYGKIAKVGGLIGHPDLLFVFDGDEIRKIFKKEEILPHRFVCSFHFYSLKRKHLNEVINIIPNNKIYISDRLCLH